MQETAPAQLRIEAVARRTGLTKRTLRYYEELGLITPSGRSEGGFRLYTETDVALIERIHRLREAAGLPLAEILELLEAESVRDRLRRRYQRTGEAAARVAMLDEARTVIARQRDILRAKRRALEDLEREYDERLQHLAEVRAGLTAETARR